MKRNESRYKGKMNVEEMREKEESRKHKTNENPWEPEQAKGSGLADILKKKKQKMKENNESAWE